GVRRVVVEGGIAAGTAARRRSPTPRGDGPPDGTTRSLASRRPLGSGIGPRPAGLWRPCRALPAPVSRIRRLAAGTCVPGAAHASGCSARNRAAGLTRARSERLTWAVRTYVQNVPFFRAPFSALSIESLSAGARPGEFRTPWRLIVAIVASIRAGA